MLLVDYREGSAELLEPLRRMGLPAENAGPPGIDADLSWEGYDAGKLVSVGVEFKKLEELIASLRTARLQGHQLLKMRDEQTGFTFNYLLVEGEWHEDTQGFMIKRVGRREFKRIPGQMKGSELRKRLDILHLNGLIRMHTSTRQQTLNEIADLYRVYTDCDLRDHQSHIAIYRAPTLTPISEFRKFFSSIDGLGLRKTIAIERHFSGSVRRAIGASKAEWMKIEGIGPELASHVQCVLDGENS